MMSREAPQSEMDLYPSVSKSFKPAFCEIETKVLPYLLSLNAEVTFSHKVADKAGMM